MWVNAECEMYKLLENSMTHSVDHVGFVGVGRMGANMARRLRDQGYTITAVYDIDARQSHTLANELACEAASSPLRVAERSRTILTVVSDDQAMRSIYAQGSESSLLRQANGRLFVNCATISPDIHIEVETLVEKHGGQTLEACMASSIPQAREGTLYLMCAGKQETLSAPAPCLIP